MLYQQDELGEAIIPLSEAVPKPSEAHMGRSSIVCIAILVFSFLGVVSACQKSDSSHEQPSAMPAVQTISYQAVESWTIPNGGFGKVIVIDSSHRNETDLRKLGRELRAEYANDRNTFILIFDDSKAASLRNEAADDVLDKKTATFYDKHMLGSYNKNGNTGYHSLNFQVSGISDTGKVIEVNY